MYEYSIVAIVTYSSSHDYYDITVHRKNADIYGQCI